MLKNNKGISLIGSLILATVITCAVIMSTNIFSPYKQRMLHSKLRYSVERLKGQTLRIPYSSIIKSVRVNPSFRTCFIKGKGCSQLSQLMPFRFLDPAGDYAIASGSGVTYDQHGFRCASTFSDLCPFLLKSRALFNNDNLEIHYTLDVHKSAAIIKGRRWHIVANISYIKNLEQFDSIYRCPDGQVLTGINSKGESLCAKLSKKNKYQFTGSYFDVLNAFSDAYEGVKALWDIFKN